MTNQFDITKHKWSDNSVEPKEDSVYQGDTLELYCGHSGEISLKKEDAIAIAKHFGIIQEIDGQLVTIHKATVEISNMDAAMGTQGMLNRQFAREQAPTMGFLFR